jgi:hypothetical protein
VEPFGIQYKNISIEGVISANVAKQYGRFEAHAARFPPLWGPSSLYLYNVFPMTTLEPVWYDCFLFMAQAISNIANRGINVTGPSLLDEMHNMTFEGVSGPLIVRSVATPDLSSSSYADTFVCSLMPIMIECRIIMYFNQVQQVQYVRWPYIHLSTIPLQLLPMFQLYHGNLWVVVVHQHVMVSLILMVILLYHHLMVHWLSYHSH